VAVQRLADPLREDGAAAQGDRSAVGALERRSRNLSLAAPELILPVALEELGDRHAEFTLHQGVGVGHLKSGLASQARGPGLAGAHEADEDQGPRPRSGRSQGVACRGYRRHPMRSL
jgi:hypothetical protein